MSTSRIVGVLAAGWIAIGAHAAEPGDLRFSGFATAGGVVLDDRSVSFTRGGLNEPGGGYLDLGSDSVVGLQMNAGLGSRTDFTLQLRAGEDDKGHYSPRVGWAFLRHAWSPELSMRVGRLRAPFFMLSDSLQVNYANPWVRPAPEVYGLNPFNDLDGADLLYQWDLGGAELEVRPYFGSGRVDFSGDGSAHLKNAKGVNLALYHGHLSVHAGHGEGRFELHWGDPEFKQLNAALHAFGFAKVADELSGDRGYARFDSLGFQWDDGAWLLSGEYVRRRANRYITSNHGWFLSLGYRLGNFTPYVTTARQVADELVARTDLPVPALNQALRGFQVSRNTAQHSVSLGVRWDVAPGLALKSEYSHVGIEPGAWGSFFPNETSDPFALGGKSIHMLSLSLDWVF
jgi:hypothetical protein